MRSASSIEFIVVNWFISSINIFVNIYIENTFTGTTSNEIGKYELSISTPKTYTVVFQYLGYKSVKKTVTIEKFPFVLDAMLLEEEIQLNEVVINSDENPNF